MSLKRFVFATDLHFGFERRSGHKVPLHDIKALNSMLAFVQDFKPDTFIWGGDLIDAGCISHHNHGKPGITEGLKLIEDVTQCRKVAIEPIEKMLPNAKKVLIKGNHERFLADLSEKFPALEGMIEAEHLLKLDGWQIIEHGGAFNLGKLTFIHGDQLSGGENVAKNAVISYERNIRFGHFHSYQAYSKTSVVSYKNAKTGILVPCLCHKQPSYGRGAPNRWMQGFNYGYILEGGNFSDSIVVVLDGKCVVNGKLYKG